MNTVTKEIIAAFQRSWAETEAFYTDLVDREDWAEKGIPFLNFIRKIKQENVSYRIGTALKNLIFSRSAEKGLRDDQKYLLIEAHHKGYEIILRDQHKLYRQYSIKDLDDERLVGLLQTLKMEPIN